ncbi:MAG TPA: transglycosylase SLT domain-containing protein [Pyrinomonadaceae bacterium]|nr:transglycosylase SLT domain-containing protein [Pyrinomonadaceae bacterium]
MNLLACSILLLTSPLCGSATYHPYNYLGLTPSVVALNPQSSSDASLAAVRRQDREARNARGVITRLTPEEHLRRASIYHANRAFDEAREHWQALMNYYPEEPRVAEALFGMGRSSFQSRRYQESYTYYDRLARTYPSTKEGREGLNFSGAALLRMGKPSEAADRYVEYINRFPSGERIETAHLNAIDTLREAGRSREALDWVSRTRQRFSGTIDETNAMFGQLRLEVAEGNWRRAVSTADELSRRSFQKGVATSPAEVAYLRAYSLDRGGYKEDAVTAYLAVPGGIDSYYGWLASERLAQLVDGKRQSLVQERLDRNRSQASVVIDRYPAPYRQAIVSTAKSRKIDPRFILAIIRQESVFRPTAKSPAGARGLLQLTIDAAQKYASNAGVTGLMENQLYQPETSILIGSEYLKDLFDMFPNLPEAVAASYNGGEDNVVRWVKRARQKDPGVFTSEIGFDETKGYVQKVMNNYRVYRQLYNADLTRR